MIIERYFSHCTQRIYNQLPYELRSNDDLSTFTKKLETLYFEKPHNMENLVIKFDCTVYFYVQLAAFSLLVVYFPGKISRKIFFIDWSTCKHFVNGRFLLIALCCLYLSLKMRIFFRASFGECLLP